MIMKIQAMEDLNCLQDSMIRQIAFRNQTTSYGQKQKTYPRTRNFVQKSNEKKTTILEKIIKLKIRHVNIIQKNTEPPLNM